MGQPYEIVGQPLSLWLAVVGTAFPIVTAAPAAPWVLVGTSGTRSQDENGVTVTHNQTVNKVRPGGALGPVKAFRSEEDLMFKLTIWDVSLEQVRVALNNNALTTTAAGVGTPGTKKIGLSRGKSVTEYALIARGDSPYGDGMVGQYQVARCYVSNSPAVVYRKGVPAGVEIEFTALEDLTAATEDVRFGSIVFQHQAAL
ncbi:MULTISPECIES: hypothetical protein [unclassified Novosphingobium]|uniref:hypothetical protein n=1 Tax=unclassified Novosphingobium TaxID=2644732 RepID=UPI000D3022E2|nr:MULTISPECIES: hypothetical protein [unclassified Novosphingobium]PTR11760.1 hypothetical protein C8K11_104119 [Novosphingobium sp. GV055]PUB04800.1 hypothetical protein C8K12_104119 [Novosphingobium sp. GV061]PUB21119.1 hypothetical protein C8K14_104119 [Novosphingobium sp. GV079]PUB42845.1 hypothetical protein C8K10_104119 [Novosphingobium sp. GV027]